MSLLKCVKEKATEGVKLYVLDHHTVLQDFQLKQCQGQLQFNRKCFQHNKVPQQKEC